MLQDEHVPSYGTTHLVPLAIFALGLVGAVWLGRRHRTAPGPTRFSRSAALLVPAVTVPFQLYDVLTDFDIDTTLPLHLCDLAWVATTWALWSHRAYPVALTFFWGLTLTIQGVVTPSLGEDFPDPRYFAFWALHLLIVWAAVYLVIGLGKVPQWRDYGLAVATTVGWAVVTASFNHVADTNYGYLQRKPDGSILDLFGPWPWYVFEEIAVVLTVWAVMTWVGQRWASSRLRRPSRGSRRPHGRSRPS
ncbi:TIGR02206 family membrane protein [Nocardioides humilatus]|uniref:TIGR02206 family membrane protein n=1 Tax=Nocardioides humilatus TaxID=2607660 RepID=A0A5B1L6L5_9ACTN|nr:TIGR02206 family membrane protein [Nocardioides humilatus]KAA1415818.1 TIGR02206 family membrane protein [Nocardioides humilatus]